MFWVRWIREDNNRIVMTRG